MTAIDDVGVVADGGHVRSWRAPTVAVALLALTGVVFVPTLIALHEKWSYWTGAYSHGYAIVAASAWLLARAGRSAEVNSRPAWLAGAALFLASATWFFAWAGGILLVQVLLLPLVLFFALLCVFGTSSWKDWLFPCTYLLFAMPFWDALTPILQVMTISATSLVVGVANVSAYVEGSFVHVASGTFEIASGCAGLHFFVVALAVFALYAHLFLAQTRHRLLLVLVASIAAVVMNWIRVTTIVLAGAATGMQHYLVTVDHYMFGWVLFTVAMVPVYVFAGRLERREIHGKAVDTTRTTTAAARIPWSRVAIASLVLTTGPAAAAFVSTVASLPDPSRFAAPDRIGEWRRGVESARLPGVDYPGSIAQAEAIYRRSDDARRLYLFANLYGRPRQGAELIGSENRLFDDKLWSPSARETIDIDLRGEPARVNGIRLQSRVGDELVMVYWYDVAGRTFAGESEVKLAEFFALLRRAPMSGLRVLALECNRDCDSARAALLAILENDGPQLGAALSGRPEPVRGSP